MHAYRPNHYEALGVARNADAEAIRAAWRARAKKLHPDRTDGRSKEAFLRLQEAYDVLRDPARRARYDATLDRETGRQTQTRQTHTGMGRSGSMPGSMPGSTRAAAARARRLWRRRMLIRRMPGYLLAALALLALVWAGMASWHNFGLSEPEAIPIVRADGDANRDDGSRLARSGREPVAPADGSILGKEVERAVQAQIGRVEAARKRLEAQLSELDARNPQAAKPPAMVAERTQCIGRGTNIVLIRDNDSALVSYDYGPEVQPRISDLGSGIVLVSRIEPSNKFAIGFTRGDRTGTTLLMFDEAGRVQQTFNVECTVSAF